MTIEEYLAEAKKPNVSNVAMVENGQMSAMILVREIRTDVFDVHVTAQPGRSSGYLLDALTAIRAFLFSVGARKIITQIGIYRGHVHKGIQRIVEHCGMKPTGRIEDDGETVWREYAITKEDYGQSV